MKEEIIRRQDIFTGFTEKELYQYKTNEQDISDTISNIITVYKADIKSLLEKMADECGEEAHTAYEGTTQDKGVNQYWYKMEFITNFRGLLK